jgi:Restriction endonuclease
MPNQLLSYAKAGVAEEYSGRNWFDRDICAYCQTWLTDLGSFHVPLENLIEIPEHDETIYVPCGPRIYQLEKGWTTKRGKAFCMQCGDLTARIDSSRPPILSERYGGQFYYPRDITPGRNCFFRVALCAQCGWWYVIENADMCNDGYAAVYAGILQRFDVSSATIPIQVLQAELPKNLQRIDGIHPKRMEDLLTHILAGIFDCEVHQLGYTRDGGVDLILLHCDRPVAVQVKRREDHRRTEGVRGIREFLGAALLQDFRRLIYVTNAGRFSAAATEAAKRAVNRGLVDQYDLISFDILQSLFPKPESVELWREAICAVMRDEYKMPSIPNPYDIRTYT